jgi:hypothetical protein
LEYQINFDSKERLRRVPISLKDMGYFSAVFDQSIHPDAQKNNKEDKIKKLDSKKCSNLTIVRKIYSV